jgi:MtN3 and saliva related transmembrane protein
MWQGRGDEGEVVITLLGLASGAMTTMSFLPQVLRSLRTRSTADLSWMWLMLFAVGTTGWLAYGLLTRDLAVAATNVVTVALVSTLVGVKSVHTLRRDPR